MWDDEKETFVRRPATVPKLDNPSGEKKEEMRTIRALNLDHNDRHPKYGKDGIIDDSQHGKNERHMSKMRERLNLLQTKESIVGGDHWKARMAEIDMKNKQRWAKEKEIKEITQRIQERDKQLEEADATIDSEIVLMQQLVDKLGKAKPSEEPTDLSLIHI